ncbi:MAG: hypothetical protein DRP42_03205 [Tenericutes bacterium]|nr:MAG: hypothetical protein DRP42_03205 [Mycoplasmatota bacterium]
MNKKCVDIDEGWQKAKQMFIEDRAGFEKVTGKLQTKEKNTFRAAWWMGFFKGMNYCMTMLQKFEEAEE